MENRRVSEVLSGQAPVTTLELSDVPSLVKTAAEQMKGELMGKIRSSIETARIDLGTTATTLRNLATRARSLISIRPVNR